MTESELLSIINDTDGATAGYLAQMISFTFAIVVATYYFLSKSGWRMKLFAFFLYLSAFFAYLTLALKEVNLRVYAMAALADIPEATRSSVTTNLLAFQHSWLAALSTVLLNGVLWLQMVGVIFFVFFWKRPDNR